jgi:hypothetical protein
MAPETGDPHMKSPAERIGIDSPQLRARSPQSAGGVIQIRSKLSETSGPSRSLPARVQMAVEEFQRLSDSVSGLLSDLLLFPALSSMTALVPVMGILRDYCASQVVYTEESGQAHAGLRGLDDVPATPGLYL